MLADYSSCGPMGKADHASVAGGSALTPKARHRTNLPPYAQRWGCRRGHCIIAAAMNDSARKRTATQKFIQQYPRCCFCAGMRPSTTREHMPPKALFDGSHRPDKLVMPACAECNNGTSTADLIASIISRWNYGASEVELTDSARLNARIRNQAPAVVEEWMRNANVLGRVKGRNHLRRHGVPVPDDASIVTIGTLSTRYLNLFAHKAALALYFEHFREPLVEPGAYCAFWKTKEDYVERGVPESLLKLLPKYATLQQGKWNSSEVFEYRHDINRLDGLFGFFARVRSGLFVSGFVVRDTKMVPPDEDDWQTPCDLLTLVDSPRFLEKR